MKNDFVIKKDSLISLVDAIFTVNGEMIEGRGEDSYSFSLKDSCGISAVFDGCGGIGSRKYKNFGNLSGAYIASHLAARAVTEWFEDFSKSGVKLTGDNLFSVCDSLKLCLKNRLGAAEKSADASAVKGSLSKSFPTTASIILFERKRQKISASFVWAGDSRGYALFENGLTQITFDDIASNADAMSNIHEDSRLSNLISAKSDFSLNFETVDCGASGILLTATDGCFGYFATPMEFEYMLLETMANADNAAGWRRNIENEVRSVTGDDYTIGIVAFGYGSFENMKAAYSNRKSALYESCISKLKNAAPEEKAELWKVYRKNYYKEI